MQLWPNENTVMSEPVVAPTSTLAATPKASAPRRRDRQRRTHPDSEPSTSPSRSLPTMKPKSEAQSSRQGQYPPRARTGGDTYMARLGPLARSLGKGAFKDVTLSSILDGKTCSPIALHDFLDFTTHKEVSSENVLFLVWFQSYRARFEALEEKERARVARPDRKLDQQRDPFGYLVVGGSETVTTLGGLSEAGTMASTSASHQHHVINSQTHTQHEVTTRGRAVLPQGGGVVHDIDEEEEGNDDVRDDATRGDTAGSSFPTPTGFSPWATVDPFSANAATSSYRFPPRPQQDSGPQGVDAPSEAPQQEPSDQVSRPQGRRRLSSGEDDPSSSVMSQRQYSADSMTPLRPFTSTSSSTAVHPVAPQGDVIGVSPPVGGFGGGMRRLSELAGSILSGAGRSNFSATTSAAERRRKKYVPAVAPAEQPMRLEAQRAFDNFLKRGSTLELNVEEELRSNCALALADSTHPDVFLPIYHDIFSMVEKQSLPHFLSYAQANINWPKQLFWYAVGSADLALSLLVFFLVLFLVPGNATSSRSVASAVGRRAYRLFSLPFALFGSMQLYSAWRGFCTQVWGRQNRQLHVWETPPPKQDDVEAGGRAPPSSTAGVDGVGTTSNHSDVTAIAPFAEPDPKDVWGLPEPTEKIEHSPTSPSSADEKQQVRPATLSPPAMNAEWDRLVPSCVMTFDLRDGLNLPRSAPGSRPTSEEAADRPAVFGPEVAIVDDRVIRLHKQVVRDILVVGAAWSLIWVALCLAIP